MFGIFIRKTKEGKIRLRWGVIIVALIALYIFVRVVWALIDPQIEIRGDVVYKKLLVDSDEKSLEIIAVRSAESAYNIAKKHIRVNKVVILLYIKQWYTKSSGWGMLGWSEKILVGEIVVENLAEVRKYKSVTEYISAGSNFYKEEIKNIDTLHHFY
jgi:hypothetical protein